MNTSHGLVYVLVAELYMYYSETFFITEMAGVTPGIYSLVYYLQCALSSGHTLRPCLMQLGLFTY